jgi:hypothetical protein
MLDVLVASRPARKRPLPAVLVSATAHVMMLYLAYAGTRAVAVHRTRPVLDTMLVFLHGTATQTAAARPEVQGSGEGGQARAIVRGGPPPQGFQLVAPPTGVPSGIPPVDLHQQVIDPRDYSGKGVEGGVSWGEEGGTGKVVAIEGTGTVRELLYAADTRDVRFSPAQMTVRPAPVYPRVLEQAGIPGRVVLQFVIDTIGLVEPGSIVVLERTDPAFVPAARDAILEARFEPARYGPRPVRQLSRIAFGFRIPDASGPPPGGG